MFCMTIPLIELNNTVSCVMSMTHYQFHRSFKTILKVTFSSFECGSVNSVYYTVLAVVFLLFFSLFYFASCHIFCHKSVFILKAWLTNPFHACRMSSEVIGKVLSVLPETKFPRAESLVSLSFLQDCSWEETVLATSAWFVNINSESVAEYLCCWHIVAVETDVMKEWWG